MLQDIEAELARLGVDDATVTLDAEFEPDAGELVKLEMGGAYWHMLPERFLALLRELPDRAGGDAVHKAIERREVIVWHGPAPRDSRDESP